MDYGNLLSRAWKIVWSHKFLFVLGFLAVLGSSYGGSNNTFNYSFGRGDFEVPRGFERDLSRFLAQFGPLLVGLICVLFVIGIVLWLVRLSAQAGLIGAVARIEAGEPVTLGESISQGTRKLGRLIGINVIMYGPFTLLGFLAAGIALAAAGTAILNALSGGRPADIEAMLVALGTVAICFVFLACLAVPVIIVVTAVYPFAQRGVVLQDLGVTASISHGWKVVRANLGDVILLIILFAVIGFVFGIVSTIVIVPLAILSFLPAIIGIVSREAIRVGDVLLIGGGTIVTSLLAAAVNSFMVAFRSTAVTLAYQEFVKKIE